jgi:hypothetical protein
MYAVVTILTSTPIKEFNSKKINNCRVYDKRHYKPFCLGMEN